MYADDTSVLMNCNDMKNLIQGVNSESCLLNTKLITKCKQNILSLLSSKENQRWSGYFHSDEY